MSALLSSRPVRVPRLGAAACGAVLVFALGACGDGDDEPDEAGSEETTSTTDASSDTGDTSDGGAADGEEIVAEDFSLTSVSVEPGAEVTVTNEGQSPHTATADDGDFDSGTVAAGETGSFVAPDEPGEYDFHCEIHPSMTGTLTVEG